MRPSRPRDGPDDRYDCSGAGQDGSVSYSETFYRNLIGGEAAPAVGLAIRELEKMQQAASGSADQWEQTDETSATQWRA